MGAHAVRNASGSKRWMNCPGSLRLADDLLRRGIAPGSSHYARLGTAAHGLCELSVRQRRHPSEWLGGSVFLDEHEDAFVVGPDPDMGDMAVQAEAEAKFWEAFPIDLDMVTAVEVYWDTVLGDLEEMGSGAELSVERRFNLNWLIGYDFDEDAADADPDYVSPSGIRRVIETNERGDPYPVLRHADGTRCWGPMFGTNDASIFQPFDLLRLYDYKHGQGVLVEVEDNSQEMYYALGIAEEVGWAFDEMELVIVQPRAPHSDGPVRRWRTTAARLREFEAELREAAIRTGDPDAPVVAGEHCTFCPAAAYCPALRDRAFDAARIEFAEVAGLPVLTSLAECGPMTTEDDLQTRLDAIPLLDAFVKAVEGEAMRRLRESGGQAFGYKLVRKKANRKLVEAIPVSDEETVPVVDHLVAVGFPREMLFEEPKLKGPAKIEKLRPPELVASLKKAGVKAPAAWIKQQVAEVSYKPEGGIAIAPAHDPRPAVDPSVAASADFEEWAEEEEA